MMRLRLSVASISRSFISMTRVVQVFMASANTRLQIISYKFAQHNKHFINTIFIFLDILRVACSSYLFRSIRSLQAIRHQIKFIKRLQQLHDIPWKTLRCRLSLKVSRSFSLFLQANRSFHCFHERLSCRYRLATLACLIIRNFNLSVIRQYCITLYES